MAYISVPQDRSPECQHAVDAALGALAQLDTAALGAALEALNPEDLRRELGGLFTETLWRTFWEGTQLILAKAAGTPALEGRGRSALSHCATATREGRPAALEVARLILDSDSAHKILGERGDILIEEAAMDGNVPFVQLLLAHEPSLARPEKRQLVSRTVYHCEDESEAIAILGALAAAGADLADACTYDGRTGLHAAASNLRPVAAAYLGARGLDPNARDKYHSAPLHLLAHGMVQDGFSDADILERARGTIAALVASGASLEALDKAGDTPLIAATMTCRMVAVALLEAGANIDGPGKDGLTALHCAAKGNHLHVVRFLLERGADARALTDAQDTPLMLAGRGGFAEAAGLIEARAQAQALEQAIPAAPGRGRLRV